jgi:hypothetical protein
MSDNRRLESAPGEGRASDTRRPPLILVQSPEDRLEIDLSVAGSEDGLKDLLVRKLVR